MANSLSVFQDSLGESDTRSLFQFYSLLTKSKLDMCCDSSKFYQISQYAVYNNLNLVVAISHARVHQLHTTAVGICGVRLVETGGDNHGDTVSRYSV